MPFISVIILTKSDPAPVSILKENFASSFVGESVSGIRPLRPWNVTRDTCLGGCLDGCLGQNSGNSVLCSHCLSIFVGESVSGTGATRSRERWDQPGSYPCDSVENIKKR